jgi:hypothetical protein
MELVEMVHLRAYSGEAGNDAAAAFHKITWSKGDPELKLKEILLLREVQVSGDLCIVLRWERLRISEKVKSPLALELASAFSEYGQIHHSVWTKERGVPLKEKEHWS